MNRAHDAVGRRVRAAIRHEDDFGKIELVDQPIAVVVIQIHDGWRHADLRRGWKRRIHGIVGRRSASRPAPLNFFRRQYLRKWHGRQRTGGRFTGSSTNSDFAFRIRRTIPIVFARTIGDARHGARAHAREIRRVSAGELLGLSATIGITFVHVLIDANRRARRTNITHANGAIAELIGRTLHIRHARVVFTNRAIGSDFTDFGRAAIEHSARIGNTRAHAIQHFAMLIGIATHAGAQIAAATHSPAAIGTDENAPAFAAHSRSAASSASTS
jgi:hypothetical protein